MTVGTVATQGTELFVIDTVSETDPLIVKMVCPTGITGGSGPRDQIENTCLDTRGNKTFTPGLGNPGQRSVPFNLVPRDGSHQALFVWKESGAVMKWVVCLSESETDPTLDTDDTFILPTDRSTLEFDAYVADVAIDFATNEIVRGTLLLQVSGTEVFTGFEPA